MSASNRFLCTLLLDRFLHARPWAGLNMTYVRDFGMALEETCCSLRFSIIFIWHFQIDYGEGGSSSHWTRLAVNRTNVWKVYMVKWLSKSFKNEQTDDSRANIVWTASERRCIALQVPSTSSVLTLSGEMLRPGAVKIQELCFIANFTDNCAGLSCKNVRPVFWLAARVHFSDVVFPGIKDGPPVLKTLISS